VTFPASVSPADVQRFQLEATNDVVHMSREARPVARGLPAIVGAVSRGNFAVYVSRRRRPGMGSACTFHTRRRTPTPRCTDAVAGKKEDLDRLERPDIEIASIVKAKRLRFGRKPRLEVSFEGEPRIDKVSGSVRENMPAEVEPGVTYRDVRVRWRAAAKLDLEDRDAR
jgi:hypothetical protein